MPQRNSYRTAFRGYARYSRETLTLIRCAGIVNNRLRKNLKKFFKNFSFSEDDLLGDLFGHLLVGHGFHGEASTTRGQAADIARIAE